MSTSNPSPGVMQSLEDSAYRLLPIYENDDVPKVMVDEFLEHIGVVLGSTLGDEFRTDYDFARIITAGDALIWIRRKTSWKALT